MMQAGTLASWAGTFAPVLYRPEYVYDYVYDPRDTSLMVELAQTLGANLNVMQSDKISFVVKF